MGTPPLASNDCCREPSKRDGNHDADGNVAILHIPICDDIPDVLLTILISAQKSCGHLEDNIIQYTVLYCGSKAVKSQGRW